MNTSSKEQAAVAVGVLGGLFLGKFALEHMFAKGLETEMRRNLVALAAGAGAIYAIAYLFDVDTGWMTTEGVSTKAQEWWLK